MITIKVMESSGDYNNHFVTIKDDDKVLFNECLIGFNCSGLSNKLDELAINKQTRSIKELDVYGYVGELEDSSIIQELQDFKEKNNEIQSI